MASVYVICVEDNNSRHVECCSIKCPSCGSLVTPRYLAMAQGRILFCQCPVHNCESFFLIEKDGLAFSLLPNHGYSKELFSDTIQLVSKDFVAIYNEAFSAEQMSLKNICGVGYRKALEFLVKDYICRGKSEEEIQSIREKKLSKCIADFVTDGRIKAVARRAVWLGNDETHYVRKWEGKDVQDLKGVIHLVIRWIEQEVETEALLKAMPEQQ